MRLSLASAALLSGVLFSSAALAATVSATSGDVQINRGAGFQRIVGTTQAAVGTVVMASPNSSGLIVYDDGCQIQVRPGEVIAIEAESPCRRMAGGDVSGHIGGGAMAAGMVGFGAYLFQKGDEPVTTITQPQTDQSPSP
jgi:hypothetical protein